VSDRIFIVGGGPSLKDLNWRLLEKEKTIAVNAAVFDVPNPDYFITMDHTFITKKIAAKRKFFESIPATRVFVVGLHHPYLKEKLGTIIDTRNRVVYRLELFHIVIKSRNAHGYAFVFKDFRNGENSGFCALQLATLLNFKRVYLLGMDLVVTDSTHYHKLYGPQRKFDEKLQIYEKNFKQGLIAIQKHSTIKVTSCSKISSLNSVIEYKSFEDVLNEE